MSSTHLMRAVYLCAVYLVAPLMLLFWVFRGLRNPAYFDRLGQRFGVGVPKLGRRSIWVHAVSVGEVQAAVPLVRRLRRRFPETPLVLTTVTPTGAARVRSVFGDDVTHAYVPFETSGAIRRFFENVNPVLAIILETEIWPNLYHECGRRDVPLVLASARISPRSVKSYRRLVPLFREALSHGIVIAAQSAADAERFRVLGAAEERTFITGNIKFDIEPAPDLARHGVDFRRQLGAARPVWVAASTHTGEEQQVLDAHEEILAAEPDALLILVPRHPERFDEVAALVERYGYGIVRRTSGEPVTAKTRVYLADTMGDLPMLYAASDVAFVAGSLVPIGGHNLLEPAALGVPIVTGPHLFNSEDIAQLFRESDASRVVTTSDALADVVTALFQDETARVALGQRAFSLLEQNRGALDRLLALIEPLLSDDVIR